MRLSRKAPGLVVIAVGLIFLVYVTLAWTMISRNTDANSSEHLEWMVSAMRSVLDTASSRALAQAEMIGMAPAVTRLFAANDRTALLAAAGPIFALQRKKYGLDQLNFYRPDGESFLRVQNPTVFGDRVDPGHSVLGAVARRGEPQSAVEVARTGAAIFGMVPIRSEGKLLGVCSVGMQFTSLVEKLHRDFGIDAAVVMDERRLREIVVDYRAAASQDTAQGYTRTAATDWSLIRTLLEGHELEGLHEPLTFLATAHDTGYGVAVLPLRDSADVLIGHLVAANDMASVGQRGRQSRVASAAFTLCSLVLVAGVVSVVFNGMLLRPVHDLVSRMEAVQNGDEALPPEPHLLGRTDEVGDLARVYQRMLPP